MIIRINQEYNIVKMPTNDIIKNVEYSEKSNEKKKQIIGEMEYNKHKAEISQRCRANKKNRIGMEEYRKQQKEYNREWRKKQKQSKQEYEEFLLFIRNCAVV